MVIISAEVATRKLAVFKIQDQTVFVWQDEDWAPVDNGVGAHLVFNDYKEILDGGKHLDSIVFLRSKSGKKLLIAGVKDKETYELNSSDEWAKSDDMSGALLTIHNQVMRIIGE